MKVKTRFFLKLKPRLDNVAQINERIGVTSNCGFVCCRSNPVLSQSPQTAGQGFVGRDLPFTHRFLAATTKQTHAALPWLSPVQTKNEAAVVSAGVRTYTCACKVVADIGYIIIPTHDSARNSGLELELAACVACRCVLSETLLPFGIRASHCVRIQRNDTALYAHKFVQLNGNPPQKRTTCHER